MSADAQHVILLEPILGVAVEAQSIGKIFTYKSMEIIFVLNWV